MSAVRNLGQMGEMGGVEWMSGVGAIVWLPFF